MNEDVLLRLGAGIVLAIIVFLAARQLLLWYWKVDLQLKYQQANTALLMDIRRLLKKQAGEISSSHELDCQTEIDKKISAIVSDLAIPDEKN